MEVDWWLALLTAEGRTYGLKLAGWYPAGSHAVGLYDGWHFFLSKDAIRAMARDDALSDRMMAAWLTGIAEGLTQGWGTRVLEVKPSIWGNGHATGHLEYE